MFRKISSLLKNGYLTLALGIIALSFFLVAEPISLDRKYNVESVKIAENTLKHVNRHYLDKSEINYGEMLKEAVSSLERIFDHVLVEFPETEEENFNIRVREKTEKFEGGNPVRSNDITSALGEAVSFVLSNSDDSVENLEYSISSGMLRALDAHSAIIPPNIYKEFLIDTEGSFGGLGIVVGIRSGQLTVISPIEGTPAYRAGIKTEDQIVQIENESTINMPLLEAVGKLRGKKGTKVNLLISRKNFSKPRKFSITRDIIKIESVYGLDLEDDILYLRIRNFQKNTSSDLIKEVTTRSHEIKGIILDLRGNPGGLLSEAEKVADFFLPQGNTIMTTKARNYSKTYRATARRPEYKGRVVVLVDRGSASASEIVAGALKNNRRALLVGTRSFGKGSVQKVFEFDDGAALKLTIANYLNPGNISIQDRGVTPNILLQGSVITEQKVVYDPLPEERENIETEKLPAPELTIKYIDESLAPADEDQEEAPQDESLTKAQRLEKLGKDFHVNISSKLLLAENPKQLRAIADDFSEKQLEKIKTLIEDTGVDWSAGENENPSVSIETTSSKTVFTAGEENFLEIKVTNVGSEPIYRLSAVTDCENLVYKNGEFLFGKLLPGQSRTSKAEFSVPKWATTRDDKLKLIFTSYGKNAFAEKDLPVTTLADDPPVYSYNYEIVEDGKLESEGNGNGIAELEETIVLNVELKNTGQGVSRKTVATLKNLSGDDVFLEKGRFEFENFNPGEIRQAPFRFRQNGQSKETEFELLVMDEDLRRVKTQKITLPAPEQKRPFLAAAANKTAVFKEESHILGASFPEAQAKAIAAKNSRVKILGSSGKWIKIEDENAVSGWVEEKAVYASFSDETVGLYGNESEGPKPSISLIEKVFERPPYITTSPFPLYTDSDSITIEGSVGDSNRIETVSVWAENDKIKLLTPNKKKVRFSFPLTLKEGMNLFTIVAKDEKGMESKKTLAVRKELS